VVATQNPVEYEGTYPLPEAQLDRFLFKVHIDYPGPDDEKNVLRMHDAGKNPHDLASLGVTPVAGPAELSAGAAGVVAVRMAPELMTYLVSLASETRRSPSLSLGVSPRGVAMLQSAAKAWAYLSGRDFVTPDDVKVLLKPTWRHRVLVRPEVELEGASADAILDGVLARVSVPD
jgi:MoxR-like ATPase